VRIDRLHVQIFDARRLLLTTDVRRRHRSLDSRLRRVATGNRSRRMLATAVDQFGRRRPDVAAALLPPRHVQLPQRRRLCSGSLWWV